MANESTVTRKRNKIWTASLKLDGSLLVGKGRREEKSLEGVLLY